MEALDGLVHSTPTPDRTVVSFDYEGYAVRVTGDLIAITAVDG